MPPPDPAGGGLARHPRPADAAEGAWEHAQPLRADAAAWLSGQMCLPSRLPATWAGVRLAAWRVHIPRPRLPCLLQWLQAPPFPSPFLSRRLSLLAHHLERQLLLFCPLGLLRLLHLHPHCQCRPLLGIWRTLSANECPATTRCPCPQHTAPSFQTKTSRCSQWPWALEHCQWPCSLPCHANQSSSTSQAFTLDSSESFSTAARTQPRHNTCAPAKRNGVAMRQHRLRHTHTVVQDPVGRLQVFHLRAICGVRLTGSSALASTCAQQGMSAKMRTTLRRSLLYLPSALVHEHELCVPSADHQALPAAVEEKPTGRHCTPHHHRNPQ